MKKLGYIKQTWTDFPGPWPEPHTIDGVAAKVPPDGEFQPANVECPGRHLGAPWMASRPIGASRPAGQDFGPYIEHRGEGLATSFKLDLTHSVPYSAGGVHPHTALLLFALAVNLRPDVILETGTFYGYSTMFLAKACDLWEQGQVWSLDPEDKLIAQEVKGHPRVRCIKERSVNAFPRVLHELGQIDLAFIDSWKRLALWEFIQVHPFVPEGGLVIFHDTQLFDSGRSLYSMLPVVAQEYDRMLFAGTPRDDNPHAFYGNADDRGLLVLRKREADPFLGVADANGAIYGHHQVFPRMDYTPVALEIAEDGRASLIDANREEEG